MPVRMARAKSASSRASGSAGSIRGTIMSPLRYVSWYSPNVSGVENSIPRSKTRIASSTAVSSYCTIRWLPTTVISRTLRGASHDTWMFARAPPANVSVMNAVSCTPSWKMLRPVAATSTTGSSSQ